uniref:Uncharacterized protein n=1 Tax=Anopheles minimus TaxID=112268 RepID=A0A182VQK1_9DIPT
MVDNRLFALASGKMLSTDGTHYFLPYRTHGYGAPGVSIVNQEVTTFRTRPSAGAGTGGRRSVRDDRCSNTEHTACGNSVIVRNGERIVCSQDYATVSMMLAAVLLAH